MSILLETRDLVKTYPGVTAVNGVNLAIAEGSCFGMLGPNGAGKTTTVEIMEGIIRPTRGDVLYRGEPAGRRFREEAGIQFQSTALQDYLTVGETLTMFHRLYDRRANLDRIITECALEPLLDRDNRKLSGGQRQRLLLAVALVNDPSVVFLDEPTTGLDPQARRNFWDLVRHIRARNTTIVLTTHYMEEAYLLCDEIVIMDQGQIIAEGSPKALLSAHYDDVILELPAEAVPAHLPGLSTRYVETSDVMQISTDDVSKTLAGLMAAAVPLQKLRIRERNLEDLFIDLTGRELRA
jgi:ABC-2 type transport system ATP-binding protein